MSRTYRRVPPEWNSWDTEDTPFINKLRRGHVKLAVRDPDSTYNEFYGKGKKWAKKRKSRKRRLTTNKIIKEQLLDK